MKHGDKICKQCECDEIERGSAFGQCKKKALSLQHIAWIKHHNFAFAKQMKKASEKKKINKLYRLKKITRIYIYYGSIIIMIICPI